MNKKLPPKRLIFALVLVKPDVSDKVTNNWPVPKPVLPLIPSLTRTNRVSLAKPPLKVSLFAPPMRISLPLVPVRVRLEGLPILPSPLASIPNLVSWVKASAELNPQFPSEETQFQLLSKCQICRNFPETFFQRTWLSPLTVSAAKVCHPA